jgi:hypothetical protein
VTIGEENTMKRALVFLVAALALPTSAALAKPSHPEKSGRSARNVQYVLKGTLSAYAAYDSSTSTNGQITIAVKRSNYHRHLLKNQALTFTLTASSKVTFRHKSTLADSTATADGVIVVRAPRRIAGDLVTGLPGAAKRIHVVVQKVPTS